MGGVSADATASSVRWAVAVALWMSSAAHAQSGACDALKQKLAARIESGGVRGYSLEIASASTPLRSGAKVIGTCDGGAYRLVYRRFAEPREAAAAPTAADTAEPVPKAKKTEAPPAPPPAAPRAREPEATVVVPAMPAPSSSPSLHPAPAPAPATLTADVTAVAPIAASDVPATPPSPEPVARPVEPSVEPPPAATPSWATRVAAFWAAHWPWICAALLVPLAALLWAWYVHHRDYDEAGLPRGPRL